MPDELIIHHCSPTLAGLKTGNLFATLFDCRETMIKDIKSTNQRIREKGLRVIPISRGGNKYLIYIFRPDRLKQDLSAPEAVEILLEKGYSVDNTSKCLTQLIRRVQGDRDFPHEIGLFLGYPPEDVSGFMKGDEKPKYSGHWKVYSNQEEAEKKFRKYKKCTEVYSAEIKKGKTLEQLIVQTKSI